MPSAEPKMITLGGFLVMIVPAAFFFPAVILLSAGNPKWTEGWLFGLWFSAMVVSTLGYMYRYNPALLAERAKAPGADNQKRWDQFLLSGIYVLAMVWRILMPLDAERFHWSPSFPLWIKILGGVLLLPALFFICKATTENTFLSAHVRIQSDRQQQVVSTGVYAFVRHPLYLGCFLMLVGAPLLIGSVAGVIISLVGVLTLVVRILGEEKLLLDELKGYAEYRKKVRFRLIPGIW